MLLAKTLNTLRRSRWQLTNHNLLNFVAKLKMTTPLAGNFRTMHFYEFAALHRADDLPETLVPTL